MRCLTTSPAGTRTSTPASWRIARTAGSVEAVTSGSRWVSSSTRLTGWRVGHRDRDARSPRGPGLIVPSVAGGVHEHLAVALGPRHAGVGRAQDRAPRRLDHPDHAAHRILPGRLVAHHAARADPLAADLELRLHHHHRTPARRQAGHQRAGSTVPSAMNDRSTGDQVDGRRAGRPATGGGRWCAPCTCTRGSPRRRPVELAVARRPGRSPRAAPRWSRQSVKPPVDAPRSRPRAPATSTASASRARGQLEPAARDVLALPAHRDLRVLGHVGPGLVDRAAVHLDPAGHDGGLGARPGGEVPAPDEHHVES